MHQLLALDSHTLNPLFFHFLSSYNDCEKHQLSKVSKTFQLISEHDTLWKKRAIQYGKPDMTMDLICNKAYVRTYIKDYIRFFLSKLPAPVKISSEDVFAAKMEIDPLIKQHINFSENWIKPCPKKVIGYPVPYIDIPTPWLDNRSSLYHVCTENEPCSAKMHLRTLHFCFEAGMDSIKDDQLKSIFHNSQNNVPTGILKSLIESGVKPNPACLTNVLLGDVEKVSQKAVQLILQTGVKPRPSDLELALKVFKPIALETLQAFIDQGVTVADTTLKFAKDCRVSDEIMNTLNTEYEKQKAESNNIEK